MMNVDEENGETKNMADDELKLNKFSIPTRYYSDDDIIGLK